MQDIYGAGEHVRAVWLPGSKAHSSRRCYAVVEREPTHGRTYDVPEQPDVDRVLIAASSACEMFEPYNKKCRTVDPLSTD